MMGGGALRADRGWGRGVRMVFFDLDGTLVYHQPDSTDIIAAFCAEIGQPVDDEAWRRGRRARHRYFVDPVIKEQLSGLTRDEFWRRYNVHMLDTLGIEGDLDGLARELVARLGAVDMAYHCPEAGCRVLGELRARGYRLGLLTNRENVERFHALLDEIELRSRFDLIVAAGEAGASKPDPAIFNSALQQAGLPASQVLYVGDNYWADVLGAQAAGIRPILLDPYHLFPEADCLVVERIEDLLLWL